MSEKPSHPAAEGGDTARLSTDGTLKILGIRFFTLGIEIVDRLVDGGLVLVPSGPGLSDDLPTKAAYREAVSNADYVIPDSGLMVLVWNALCRGKEQRPIARYSGLRLLWDLLPRREVREAGASYWIMPDEAELDRTLTWLREAEDDRSERSDFYLAPVYRDKLGKDGRVEDPTLLAELEHRRPRYVFVNVGSGVQEQLGWYLRERLSYRPAIICTGAAIAFMTGGQAPIPPLADKIYLGWLVRVMRNPRRFGKRYFSAFKLVPLMLKYREMMPPLRGA